MQVVGQMDRELALGSVIRIQRSERGPALHGRVETCLQELEEWQCVGYPRPCSSSLPLPDYSTPLGLAISLNIPSQRLKELTHVPLARATRRFSWGVEENAESLLD